MSEANLFRNRKAQSREVKFEPMTPRRNLKPRPRVAEFGHRVVIHKQILNHNGWGALIFFDIVRIDRHQPLAGWEPKSSVRSPAAGRLHAARALQSRQSFALAVSKAFQPVRLAVSACVQFS